MTALKTVAMRLRGTSVKEMEEEGLDTDGAVTSKSKLQSQVKALSGVNILTDAGAYKSTYQILSEIADVWEDINDMDQAALLELLAGKRAGSVMSAILQNPETLKDAFESANEAQGSALAENEKYLDSIQGRIDLFNNSLQTMWSNELNSDVIKWFVELGRVIVETIDFIGLLPTAFIAISVAIMKMTKMNLVEYFGSISDGILKFVSKTKSFATGLTGATTATQALTAATIEQSVANNAITTTEAIRQATTNGLILSQVALNDAELAGILTATGLSDVEAQAIANKLGLTSAAQTLTLATLQQAMANGTLTASEVTRLGVATGLIAASASLTAAKATEILTSQGVAQAEAQEIITKLGLGTTTKTLTAATIQQAVANGTLAPTLGATAMGLLGVDLAAKGLTGSFIALWTAMWPILAVMVAIAGVVGIVKLFDGLITTTAEASEELKETRKNLEDLESELDSLNNELDTTKQKIAELEALPSLSLVQKEELDELNATLDRLEMQQKIKQREIEVATNKAINDGIDVINSKFYGTGSDKYYDDDYSTGAIEEDTWLTYGQSGEDVLEIAFDNYQERQKKVEEINNKLINETDPDEISDLQEEKEELEKEMREIATSVENFFADEDYNGWSYGMDEDIDKFLDDFYHYQDRWEQIYSGGSDKSGIIQSIFGRNPTKEIKQLEKDIQEIMAGDGSWEDKNTEIVDLLNNITNLDDGYQHLALAVDDLGVSYQDIADYFTIQDGEFSSNTMEGVAAQYQKGAEALEAFKNQQTISYTDDDGNKIEVGFDDLFELDAESNEWKAIDTQISKVLKGADETTRKEFGNLIETIKNEEVNFDDAIKSFGLSGVQRGLKLIEASVIEINTSMFKDVKDDLNGLIDTFGELGSALESVAGSFELLQQANKEMNHSNRLSIETALKLIDSTEDWNDVLTISNGVITLNENATDTLINSKLDQIRTNIQLKIKELETAKAQATAAESGEDLGLTLEESTNESIRQVAGNLGYLTELLAAFAEGDYSNAFSRAASAKTESLNATKVIKNQTNSGMSKAEIDKQLEDAYAELDMINGVNADNFEGNYYSDIVGGSSLDSKTSEALDKFQKAMKYYENRISANQAKYEQIQNEIDLLEKQGKVAGEEYYQEQINLENERLELLEAQKAEAQKYLKTFKEGSDEYWEVAGQLNDIESSIDDVTSSIQDLNDAMAEVDWYVFDETHKRFGSLIDDLNTIRDLISPNGEEDWFEDGMWTDKGVASLATHIQQLQMYQNALDDTNKKLEEYNKPYAGNEEYYKALGIDSEQELFDKREELIDQQYDYKTAINDTQQSVVDMYEAQIGAVEEWADKAIDAYNDYIDVVKEALDAERDLHDFKKSIEEDTTNIAELERKIASLSGSTDAADIAQIRKLQAELNKAKSDLDDKYYDHAKDAQSDALDSEADAYEKSMKHFVSNLRTSLDTALLDMDKFMKGVTAAVINNAPAIKEQYNNLGLSLDEAIIDPWTEAADAMADYETNGLGIMNGWITEGGAIYDFSINANDLLQTPWQDGETAITSFENSVKTAMSNVVTDVTSNVANASAQLSALYDQIVETQRKINNVTISSGGTTTVGGKTAAQQKEEARVAVQNYIDSHGMLEGDKNRWGQDSAFLKLYQAYTALGGQLSDLKGKTETVKGNKILKVIGSTDKQIGVGSEAFVKSNTKTIGKIDYYHNTSEDVYYRLDELKKSNSSRNPGYYIPKGTKKYKYYAKGTLGTKRDEWAITDESWIGEEITLAAGRNGQLQYLKKGSAVMPSDISANLVEWGKLDPNMMNLTNPTANINMINNAVNKPELNLTFDSLVHVDHCDEGTLKNLEKMVDTKINDFSKQLNYSIKKFAR